MPLTSILAAAFLFQAPQATVTDVKVGEGTEAKLGDVVTINYVGKFLDGQMLDSTKMTAPYAFILGTRPLIQGHARIPFAAFDKSLVGMKVGGTRTIVLPPELAFGDLQVGDIPPNTKLTFEVELFDVRPKGSEAKLKIEDLKEGTGEAAKEGDVVEAHYRGTFLNGRQFDTSYGRMTDTGPQDLPIKVTLGARGIIEGFQKGLTGMKVGRQRRETSPFEIAY
jgi:peptidylprolyl isomerase